MKNFLYHNYTKQVFWFNFELPIEPILRAQIGRDLESLYWIKIACFLSDTELQVTIEEEHVDCHDAWDVERYVNEKYFPNEE